MAVEFKKQVIKEKLVDVAYREIKNAILSHVFKPGECLSTNLMAETLNMSRTPIREALNMLVSEGLIEIHNGVGIYVKGVSLKYIVELYEVRITLEVMAIESAFDKIEASCLEDLYSKWMALKIKHSNDEPLDLLAVSELDNETHLTLISYCENEYLKQLLSEIYSQVRRIQYMSAKALGDLHITIDQHFELLDSIRNQDIDAYRKIMPQHVRDASAYIKNNTYSVNL